MQLAEARADRDGLADEAGRDAVAVALKGDQGGPRDHPLDLQLRGERRRRQRAQVLLGGDFGDRSARPLALVGDRDRPAVQVGLGLAD